MSLARPLISGFITRIIDLRHVMYVKRLIGIGMVFDRFIGLMIS